MGNKSSRAQQSGAKQPTDRKAPPQLVISIDFGTYASGYALQWRSDYDSNPLKIYHTTTWNGNRNLCTYKTPTCLLLKSDKSFEDFGYQADETYASKTNDTEKQLCYMFRHFKMQLYNRADSNEEITIEDVHGKHLQACEVLSKSIEYLKNHALQKLKNGSDLYVETDVRWVITVPAIWDERAKQIMRKSALMAGIESENLILALEAECAAIYCSHIPEDQLGTNTDLGKRKVFTHPSTVMVVDIGGGTIDVTTLQFNKTSNNEISMSQVQQCSGAQWGGMHINQNVMRMLRSIIGDNVMMKFAMEHTVEEIDLQREIERMKREVKHPSEMKSNDKFFIMLPQSLKELWEKQEHMSLQDIIKNNIKCKDMSFKNGRLFLEPCIIWKCFDDTIKYVIEFVTKTIQNLSPRNIDIDSLLLVGGCSESNYILQTIRGSLNEARITVLRPQACEMTVLNGAVIFGHYPEIITTRIMRHTYGIGMVMEFDQEKHSQEMKFEAGGKYWANNVFRKHVSLGDEVRIGQWVPTKVYFPVDEKQTSATIFVYSSDQKDPIHTTEIGCKYIGKFDIHFSKTEDRRHRRAHANEDKVSIEMCFGWTEIKIRVVTNRSGQVYEEEMALM